MTTPASHAPSAAALLFLLGACACTGAERSDRPAGRNSALPARPSESWTLDPRGDTGAVSRQSSEADLERRFGAAEVRRMRIQLGEGETAAGTVLFPGDSTRRAEIIWRDTVSARVPVRVVLRGRESRWRLPGGISLGTSLLELERSNGGAFTLAGFGWDYSGVITDWRRGRLAELLGRGVRIYLSPADSSMALPEYTRVLGDRNFSSGDPAMQRLDPRVYQIFLDFE